MLGQDTRGDNMNEQTLLHAADGAMNSKDRATPRPWSVSHRHIYKNDWAKENGQWIDHALATVDEGPTREEAIANAALIVEAVNAYDALRKENAALREVLEAVMARLDGVFDHPSLVKQGPLRGTSMMDVRRFTKAALERSKMETT